MVAGWKTAPDCACFGALWRLNVARRLLCCPLGAGWWSEIGFHKKVWLDRCTPYPWGRVWRGAEHKVLLPEVPLGHHLRGRTQASERSEGVGE